MTTISPDQLCNVTGGKDKGGGIFGGIKDKIFGKSTPTHWGDENLFAPSGGPQSGTPLYSKIFGGPGSKGIFGGG